MQKSLYFFLKQIISNHNNGASYAQLRHFFNWKRSLNPAASSIKDELPWITYDAIDFLKSNVTDRSKIFEYGGGGSTLFFVKRSAEVVTVEHDKEWFQVLTRIIKDKKYSNWKGEFIPPEKGDIFPTPDRAAPEHYSSDDEKSRGFNYKKYVSFIDNFSDNYFDFVLVDGRSRASCISHSVNKIKKNGFLILDNSDRAYYTERLKKNLEDNFVLIIDNSGASPYSDSFTRTSVWRKK